MKLNFRYHFVIVPFFFLRYEIMMNCWEKEPQDRPSFNSLTKQLKRIEDQHKVRLSRSLRKRHFKIYIFFSHKILLHLKLRKTVGIFFSHFHNVKKKITEMVPNHSTDTMANCGLCILRLRNTERGSICNKIYFSTCTLNLHGISERLSIN